MSEKFLDTYFFDSKLAREVALKKNRAETKNPNVKGLQICYYNGEKLKKSPKNCIHLPLDKIYSYFRTTNYRFPQFVSFNNTNFSKQDQISFNQKMTDILALSIAGNNLLVEKYKKKIKKNQPDFSEKKLRVFVAACRETVVMQYHSKNIAQSFKNIGYDVKFYIQNNDMESCGALANYKALYEFNPHITISINHFNNEYLNTSILNFVWFQDPMPCLEDNSILDTRKNDFVFHLVPDFKRLLEKKNIHSQYQPFCIDTSIHKIRKKINREDKIVFIGSSYKERISKINEQEMHSLKKLISIFEIKGIITDEEIDFISTHHKIPVTKINFFIGYIIRDILILQLCQLNIPYKIEIYGYGWEEYDELEPYYNGPVTPGKDISKIYNSARYVFVPAQNVLQQRTLEGAANGAIPIAYDNRSSIEEANKIDYTESVIYFHKTDELENVLHKDVVVEKDLKHLLKKNKYKSFIKKMHKIIKSHTLKDQRN